MRTCDQAAPTPLSMTPQATQAVNSLIGNSPLEMAATPLQSARSLLARAVELDTAQRYSEALICYEEAIQMLIKCIPGNAVIE